MSRDTWEEAKDIIGKDHRLELGPYYAHQALFEPRHLLFTLSRSKFAARMLPLDQAVSVLELGCSEGIGTVMLSEGGNEVTGVDFDKEAIDHAKTSLRGTGIRFLCDDFLGKTYGSYDAVISLDVIEHIPRSGVDEFLRTVCMNLKEDGFCVIGTPNETASRYAGDASRAAHLSAFTGEELLVLMRRYFRNVFLFGMNDEVVHTGFSPMAHYLMVLGCGRTYEGEGT